MQNSLPEAMELVAATALQDSERITTHFMDMFASFAGVHSAPSEEMVYEVLVEMEPRSSSRETINPSRSRCSRREMIRRWRVTWSGL